MFLTAYWLALAPKREGRWTRRKVEFPFYFSAEGKSVHIAAELVDKPSVLAQVLSRLRSKVDFVGIATYSVGNNRTIFSGIGILKSASDSAQSIERLMSLPGLVRRSEVTGSKNGLLIDRFHTGLEVGTGEPCLILPTAVLASTFEAVVREFGSGGETILFNQGKAYAQARWAGLGRAFGPDPRTRLDDVAAMTGAVGWAIVEIKHTPGSNILECVNHECFECSGLTKGGHGCPFLRGMAVGLVESVYRTKVTSQETRCRKNGYDSCDFVMKTIDGRPLD
jgi:predicted hydrocarbon binding protein